jgi:NAD(P)-dependent dehydrogenase (short-subunit alcohol dehydrogenase family)
VSTPTLQEIGETIAANLRAHGHPVIGVSLRTDVDACQLAVRALSGLMLTVTCSVPVPPATRQAIIAAVAEAEQRVRYATAAADHPVSRQGFETGGDTFYGIAAPDPEIARGVT